MQKSMLYLIEIISKLSTSEYMIFKAICHGKTYKQIASENFIDVVRSGLMLRELLKNSMQSL